MKEDETRRSRMEARQGRLRERFLDLGNSFVNVRMRFLRAIGAQPPDPESEKGDDTSPSRR